MKLYPISTNQIFTNEHTIWIVFVHGKEKSPASLRIKFLIKYGIKGRKATLHQAYLFTRVVKNAQSPEQLKKKGISKGKIPGSPSSEKTQEAKVLIENEIKENSRQSIQNIARKLNSKESTTYRIMRKLLQMKPYKLHRCQTLSNVNGSRKIPLTHRK